MQVVRGRARLTPCMEHHTHTPHSVANHTHTNHTHAPEHLAGMVLFNMLLIVFATGRPYYVHFMKRKLTSEKIIDLSKVM